MEEDGEILLDFFFFFFAWFCEVPSILKTSWIRKGRKCQVSSAKLHGPPSCKRVVRSEYGGFDVVVALAVHLLDVTFDAVAAVDLCER